MLDYNQGEGSQDNGQEPEPKYFAAKEPKKVMNTVLARGVSFYKTMQDNNWKDKLGDMYRAYHGQQTTLDHEITISGDQGELLEIPVNHFRNIARNMYGMITSTRPAMDVLATNTDYKSLAQTTLASGILEYYMREKKLEEAFLRAVEQSIILGVGYVKLEWNANSGDEYDVDPETGKLAYSGEAEFANPSFYDVWFDGTKESWKNEWCCIRSFENKYNISAKYPELKDKIEALSSMSELAQSRLHMWSNDETDDVPVFEFYHEKSPAMPNGRYILALSEDIILIDVALPYRKIPLFRIVPSEVMGTPYGYSPMFDCFPIQEMINACYSTIATNISNLGVQRIWIPEGANITESEVSEGMSFIESSAPPQPIKLLDTPPEIFNFAKDLVKTLEDISGINSVTRGSPQASLESGSALALVAGMSIQYINQLNQNYARLIEDVGTNLLNILKDYADTPKLVTLVGKFNKPYLKQFTGDLIKDVNRVRVDLGNPLARTLAGRVQMAEQWLKMGLIKTPEQYLQVQTTGRLDVVYESANAQMMLIRSENEGLTEGVVPQAILTDNHLLHINEHSGILSNPDLRGDQELTGNVLQHIQEHIDLLRNTDPQILITLGQQPLQPEPQEQLPPGPPSANGAPSDVQESPMAQPGPTAQMPGMPSMPAIPQPMGQPNMSM
jgi:hypothetical protein